MAPIDRDPDTAGEGLPKCKTLAAISAGSSTKKKPASV